MTKTGESLIKGNKIGPAIRSKRVIKKSGGDDFVNNVRCLKPKRNKGRKIV